MSAVIGALRAELSAQIAQFMQDMGKAGDAVAGFQRRFDAIGRSMQKTGAIMSAAVTAPIVALGAQSLNAFQESEKAVAAVDAALKSMGDAAGFTSQQLQDMAAQLQATSTFDDDQILDKVTANFLTFGNIQGEVFARAQQATLDLSARLGQDLQSSAIQVGKALNDPIKGITALSRVGVSFTEEQKEMIKTLAETGRVAEAQGIILSELERQYGGQAAAMAATSQGQMQQLTNSWGDFQEVVGQVIAQVLPPLVDMLRGVVQWLNTLEPETVAWGVAIAGIAAAVGPVLLALGTFITALGSLGALVPVVTAAATAIGAAIALMGGPITLIVTAIAGLAAAWLLYGEEIKKYAAQLYAAVDTALGGRLTQIVEAAKVLFSVFLEHMRLVFQMIGQIFTGDFRGALDTFTQIFQNAWTGAKAFLDALLPGFLESLINWGIQVVETVGNTVTAIGTWLREKLGAIFDYVGEKVAEVKGYFRDLYQAVVGGSYVPDMVDGIQAEFARLPDVMVAPAEDAANSVGSAFQSVGQKVGGLLRDWAEDGKITLDSLARAAEDLIQTTVLPALQKSSEDTSSSGGGFFSSLLSGFFGGGGSFAGLFGTGGTIPMGDWGIVGDRGPEPIFAGSHDLHVLPNSALGGGGNVFNFYMPNVRDSDDLRRTAPQVMEQAARRADRARTRNRG